MVCGSMRLTTQVAIIGGGPSGLLLSQLLSIAGIETVVLERASRAHVLARIRAGVLEWNTVDLLRYAEVTANLDRRGTPHSGCLLSHNDDETRIDFLGLTGKQVMLFGQTELTADLYRALDKQDTPVFHDVTDVKLSGLKDDQSQVQFRQDGQDFVIDCKYIAGCDGFHGISRASIPKAQLQTFTKTFPFSWLGILAKAPPVSSELIYAASDEGFALASMRSADLARCYIQVPTTEYVQHWSDQQFWDGFARRLPSHAAALLSRGPSIEKTIAAVRSFVCEPMRWGNLFLVGDSAHIVPPTGAKGLNLAAADVRYLSEALIDALGHSRSTTGIDTYSTRALQRVWKVMRFSNQMTQLLHKFETEDAFAKKMRESVFRHLATSETARRDFAENYVGLPH